MSEAKHTPGPWAQQLASNGVTVRHVQIVSDAGDVATAIWQGGERQTNANARLIAAAPELLEALQEVTMVLDRIFGVEGREPDAESISGRARAAIAKATGKKAA